MCVCVCVFLAADPGRPARDAHARVRPRREREVDVARGSDGGDVVAVHAPVSAQREQPSAGRQGLTLVQFSAQLEPCLTQENTLHTLSNP